MTSEQEFEDFVARNRDLIERMIQLQKGAATEFVGAERELAREAYGYARGYADRGRTRTEDAIRGAYNAFTDPEVQRHFVNMGMEFFMGMSALMERAPMPDAVRDGYRTAEESVRDAACRSRDCGRRTQPQKVSIISDGRSDAADVFKGCEE